MTKCNTFVGDTAFGCSLEAGHKSADCVAFDGVTGREVARAPWPIGRLKGVKTYVPVPRDRQHDSIRVPAHTGMRTLHQRRFAAFLDGEQLPEGTIVSGSLEFAVKVTRELGGDEVRLLREYHNA